MEKYKNELIGYDRLLHIIQMYPDCIDIIKESYLKLLGELSEINFISNKLFIENIEKIHNNGCIFVCYIGSPISNNNPFKIIASGTLFIEPKIIRNGKNVGHIEDIVVLSSYRNRGISQAILNILKNKAISNNCYKVILNCNDEVKQVYIKNGFKIVGHQMAIYF